MARVERICPAMGLTPIPECDLMHIDIHDVKSFEQYSGCTRKAQIRFRAVCKERTDCPLELVRIPSVRKEIPQVAYEVTYMIFPSATWEPKAKKSSRKGGSFTTFEKCVVMPHTGDPQYGGIPAEWKVIMTQLNPETHIPYKVRMSQDQAEEASDEKRTRSAQR